MSKFTPVKKSQPTSSDVHIDAPLSNISTAYLQTAEQFVSTRVFPRVPVAKQSDKYFTYTKGDWRRNIVKQRPPGTESAGSGYGMSNDNYFCDVYALHKDIPDQVRANADAIVNVDRDAAEWLMQMFLIHKEAAWASAFFATGVWDTDVTGGTDFTVWSNASSDPEADIDTGKDAILQNTGYEPNTLVVSLATHRALKRHPLIRDKYKHTSAGNISSSLIAAALEVDNYMVARASYNTADEGATDSNSMIMGNNALLCYVNPNPSPLTPSAGYSFVWNGLTGMSEIEAAITTFRMQKIKSDRIEGEFAWDHKQVGSDLGYFYSGTV